MNVAGQLRHSQFLRHNGVFFVGSVAVGVLNYLYYPILGRLLAPDAFGEVQTLISLFLQATIFLSVLGLVTINVVANYRDAGKRNAVVLELEKVALLVSLTLLVGVLVFQRPLQNFLQFNSALPIVLLAVALVTTVPLTFRSAMLRGMQRFGSVSAANMLSAGGKLLFAVLLVGVGWGAAGAIGGLVAAQILASVAVGWWAYGQGLRRPDDSPLLKLPNRRVVRPQLRYGLFVLIGSLVITLQYSLDVIVVKHYFDPTTAGLYAGLATVARIIFFLTASIALVLMPMVKLDGERAANRRLLLKSLLLAGLVGGPVTLLMVLAPHNVTSALMGNAYSQFADLLPRLAIALFIISLLNVVVSYYLALRQYKALPALVVGGVATYLLLLFNHATITAVVNDVLIGSGVMLAALGFWAVTTKSQGEAA